MLDFQANEMARIVQVFAAKSEDCSSVITAPKWKQRTNSCKASSDHHTKQLNKRDFKTQ